MNVTSTFLWLFHIYCGAFLMGLAPLLLHTVLKWWFEIEFLLERFWCIVFLLIALGHHNYGGEEPFNSLLRESVLKSRA